MLQHVTRSKDTRRRATYEDLLKVPDHLVAEIIDGVLYTSPRPAPRHALAGSALGGVLVQPFQMGRDGPGGWRILDEPELHFKQDVLVPDLAGWRRERMPTMPDTAYFALAPDWVCEVLSPSTAKLDRTRKLQIYARERIPHAWFIDPLARTLEVMVLTKTHWTVTALQQGDERVRAVPFDAISIALPDIWDVE